MNKEKALANILEKVREFSLAASDPLEYVQMSKSEFYQEMSDECDKAEAELISTIKQELK